MSSLRIGARTLAPLSVVAVFAVISGCGGGGGGSDSAPAAAQVVATSFTGFPAAPNGGPPLVIRDEALEFRFSAEIDPTSLGGLLRDGSGQLETLQAFSSGGPVAYHPFVDQASANLAVQIVADGDGEAHLGVVGISAGDPRVLVFDPRVEFSNPFGLDGTFGLRAGLQYDVMIPAGSGLTTMTGSPLPFGAPPPVAAPPFSPSPPPSAVLFTGAGYRPDVVPPRVVRITSASLVAAGIDPLTATSLPPIPDDDTIIVQFDEPIDAVSVDRLANLVIRNVSVVTTSSPQGVIVPVVLTSNADGSTLMFTPDPGFGEGENGGATGYTITVSVGTNSDPASDILDLPSGTRGTGNSLANALVQSFTTIPNPGAQTVASIPEDFSTTNNRDATYSPPYNAAEWNLPDGAGGTTGQLRGFPVVGVPTQGSAGLGTGPGRRLQFTITPNGAIPAGGGCQTPTCFYTAPFDDSGTNNLGVNPNGGSHLQLMYLANGLELPAGLADSVELLEWFSPATAGAFVFSFDGFTMKMSHTAADAQTPAAPQQLVGVYDLNFDYPNPQNSWIQPAAHPAPTLPPIMAPVTVLPSQTYRVGDFTIAPGPIPFPVLDLPFDYDDNRLFPNAVGALVNPNLLVDIDVPAPVAVNGNVWVGSNSNSPIPTRRLIGGPGAPLRFAQDSVVHHARFTIVKKNSSARTTFFDLGAGVLPIYRSLDLSPPIDLRPDGTFITVSVRGATALAGGIPTGGDTGFRTYVTRGGLIQPDQLQLLDGSRFFQVRFDLESNTRTNVSPFVSGFLLGYSF